jgi:tetratricopeptide (TPR) repeat protein
MASIFDKFFKGKASAAPLPAATEPPAASPARYEALFAQASAEVAACNFQRAIQFYDQAIVADPARAEAYYKRANALKDLGQFDAAIAGYRQAVEHKSDYAHAYCNLAFVEHRLGRLDNALANYDRAIALDPTDAFAHYNRALLMQDCCRWEEALASYDRAIAANPRFADAQYNRAVNLLYQGDFERGWRSYEWRWKNAERLGIGEVRNFRQPLWLGQEAVQGKRVLLHSEQGLGDTIQFCRYASRVAALGATVTLEVPAPLLNVLGAVEGVSQIIAKGEHLPPFDYHCPLMSLPLAFKTTVATIPAPAKYLHSDPARVAQWQTLLGERTRARIGLVWSGNPKNIIDQRRSIPLAQWVAHLPIEYQYFQLQTQVREADMQALDSGESIFSFEDDLLDFANTAALCECMDLVLSVDTSLAHLSGALGVRTWVLLACAADWRWLRDRDDSPWYPSVMLYRQTTVGDWDAVFARVAADLHREFQTA